MGAMRIAAVRGCYLPHSAKEKGKLKYLRRQERLRLEASATPTAKPSRPKPTPDVEREVTP